MDAGWTLGGLLVDGIKILERNGHGRWTGWSRKVYGMITEGGRDGHGRWTGLSRKVDGMVTECGRNGHGRATVSGQNRKIYCIDYFKN